MVCIRGRITDLSRHNEYIHVDNPLKCKRHQVDIHQSMVRLEPLKLVHSRDHSLYPQQGHHKHSRYEKEEHIYAHPPHKRARDRANNEPSDRQRYKSQICK